MSTPDQFVMRPASTSMFLRHVFGLAPDDHHIVVTSAPIGGVDWIAGADGQRRAVHRSFPVTKLDSAAGWAAGQGPHRNLYVSVCTIDQPLTGGRVKSADAAGLPGFWADIDIAGPGHKPAPGSHLPPTIADGLELIDDSAIPASIVIETGGGLHAWWLFDQYVTLDDGTRPHWQASSKRWHDGLAQAGKWRGWHVDRVPDLARVMRLPGTWRTKQADPQPRPVRFHDSTTAQRWPADFIISATIEPDPAPPPSPRSKPASGTRTGCYGPADAIADAMTWAGILEPHGWEHVGTDTTADNAELWRRPGAESAYSLKCWPDAATCWSSALGWPTGVGLSKFEVWWRINGYLGGSEAATDIRRQQNERRKGATR